MKFLIPNKPTGRMCLFKSAPSDVEEIFSGYLETNISDRYSQMIALCLKIVDYRSWTGYPRSLKRVVCGSLPTIRCQERWQHKAPICSARRFFLIIWANFEIFLFLSWSLENPNRTYVRLSTYLRSTSGRDGTPPGVFTFTGSDLFFRKCFPSLFYIIIIVIISSLIQVQT